MGLGPPHAHPGQVREHHVQAGRSGADGALLLLVPVLTEPCGAQARLTGQQLRVAVAAALAASRRPHLVVLVERVPWGDQGLDRRRAGDDAPLLDRRVQWLPLLRLTAPQIGGRTDVLLGVGGDDPRRGPHGPLALGVAGAQSAVLGGARLDVAESGAHGQAAFRVVRRCGAADWPGASRAV